MRRDRLQDFDVHVMAKLLKYKPLVNYARWATKSYLASQLKCSPRRVQYALRRLIDRKFLTRQLVPIPDPDDRRNRDGVPVSLALPCGLSRGDEGRAGPVRPPADGATQGPGSPTSCPGPPCPGPCPGRAAPHRPGRRSGPGRRPDRRPGLARSPPPPRSRSSRRSWSSCPKASMRPLKPPASSSGMRNVADEIRADHPLHRPADSRALGPFRLGRCLVARRPL